MHGATIPNALQVPASAILPGEDGSTNVMVVGGDSTAHRSASSNSASALPEKVQILDGITPADTVITEGGYGLDDGTKVKIGGKDEGDDRRQGPGDKD